jgi:hypothetical protein
MRMHDELQDSRTGKLTPTLSDLLRTARMVDQQQRRYDHPPALIEELALVTQQRSGPPSDLKTEQLSRCPQAFHNEQGRKEPQNRRPSVRARSWLGSHPRSVRLFTLIVPAAVILWIALQSLGS